MLIASKLYAKIKQITKMHAIKNRIFSNAYFHINESFEVHGNSVTEFEQSSYAETK